MPHTIVKAVVFAALCLSLTQMSHAQSISTTLAAQTGNNTAACSGQNDPLGNHPYCAGYFAGFPTDPANSNAQTQVADAVPRHMSHLQLSRYLYDGATTKFVAPYQPWFCTSGDPGPYNGMQECDLDDAGHHKVVG